jgi:hypothetical protein
MNIVEELKKHNIALVIDNQTFTFTMPDKNVKVVQQHELENYLALCLINYITH